MKKSLYLLLSICLLHSACKDEDDKVPNRTVFKFTATYLYSPNVDFWIVLHDNASGDVIDAKQIPAANTPVIFESTKPISNNMIDVTIFQGIPNSTTGNAAAEVYPGIDVGSEWVWPQGIPNTYPDAGGNAGTYTLKVTGVPSVSSFQISDAFGSRLSNSYTFSGGTATAAVGITGNGHMQLVSIDTGGKPKYTMINDPVDGKAVTVDYGTFKEYDRYLNLTFPKTTSLSGSNLGYQETTPINWNSFVIQRYDLSSAERTEVNIGILNTFTKYSIEIQLANYFNYIAYGPAPASISFVAPSSFHTSGTTLEDYTVTSSASFTFRKANFGYSEPGRSISFDYYAPQGSPFKHHDAINTDLESKYGIDPSKLKNYGTMFTPNGRSYSDLLKFYFDASFDQFTPYQETRVYIGN